MNSWKFLWIAICETGDFTKLLWKIVRMKYSKYQTLVGNTEWAKIPKSEDGTISASVIFEVVMRKFWFHGKTFRLFNWIFIDIGRLPSIFGHAKWEVLCQISKLSTYSKSLTFIRFWKYSVQDISIFSICRLRE